MVNMMRFGEHLGTSNRQVSNIGLLQDVDPNFFSRKKEELEKNESEE